MNNNLKYNQENKNDKVDIKKMYGKECISPVEEFVSEIKSDLNNGLTERQLQANYELYGKNELNSSKPKRWYQFFLASLITPFNLILIGIIVVLIYTDVYLTNPPSYANIIVIIALILLSTFLEFFIVYKSKKKLTLREVK